MPNISLVFWGNGVSSKNVFEIYWPLNLEFIPLFFQWGYGNWKEIAHHIETKTPEQTKQEYLRNYIYGVVGRYTWKEELRGYQIDHTQVNLL